MNMRMLAATALVSVGLELCGAEDWTLAYQLDISRMKVPTMETLRRMVDVLASLGYNQFQLYTEHTFAYRGHETVWAEASPMLPDEIRALDAYCAARGVELVPNQNSFGHFNQWLRHPEYNDLAEMPQGGAVIRMWGTTMAQPSALCPTDPRSLELVRGLYDQLLPCFRSTKFNVGCDETLELEYGEGKGRSAAQIAEKGAARVYLEFLKKVHGLVAERRHTMMFWGDIVQMHPELIPELPKDVIALDWGYEANHPFEKEASVLQEAGCDYYVCPGTSAWGSLFGRTSNMMSNVVSAVRAGRRHGASGLMLADWGDGGHPNVWLVSLPAIVHASQLARGADATRASVAAGVDGITGGHCGEALLGMGDVYRTVGGRKGNTAELYYMLTQGTRYVRAKGVTDESVAAAFAEWRAARAKVDVSGMKEWAKEDLAMMDLLFEALVQRTVNPGIRNFQAMFEPRYRRLWLRQNRRGGLQASLQTLFR